MDVYSNEEKHWNRLPTLKSILADKPIPADRYHHSGICSPYTTVLDDLHDVAKISAIVAANQIDVLIALFKTHIEDEAQSAEYLGRLVEELKLLHDQAIACTRRLHCDMDAIHRFQQELANTIYEQK